MAIKTEDVHYKDGATACTGILAYDEARAGRKPGVVLFHETGGMSPNVKQRTRLIAELGYVGLAADMFGGGAQVKGREEARALVDGLVGNPVMLRARAKAALSVLASHPQVDAGKLFAIGFCFGGTVALELARAGEPLLGAFSFHGVPSARMPAQKGTIKASVVACQGAEDPFVPAAKRIEFEEEMRAAGADWQLIVYGNTQHNFTTSDPAIAGIPGLGYNALADRRSWQTMCDFFKERLAAVA